MAKKKTDNMTFTTCIICGERVQVKKSTSTPRDTCPRIKVGNKMVKSDCERKKDRKYQEGYREANKQDGKKQKKGAHVQNSFAVSDTDHITVKQDNEKRKVICLKCNKKFTATGKYNRICSKCKQENKGVKY